MLFNKKNILILSLAIFSLVFLGALSSYFFHDQGVEDTNHELEEGLEEETTPEVTEDEEDLEEVQDMEEDEEDANVFDEPPIEESPEESEEAEETEEEFVE